MVRDWPDPGYGLNSALLNPAEGDCAMGGFLAPFCPGAYMAGLDLRDCFLYWLAASQPKAPPGGAPSCRGASWSLPVPVLQPRVIPLSVLRYGSSTLLMAYNWAGKTAVAPSRIAPWQCLRRCFQGWVYVFMPKNPHAGDCASPYLDWVSTWAPGVCRSRSPKGGGRKDRSCVPPC